MSRVTTRECLISLLQAWQDNKITAEDVQDTAEALSWDILMIDWEDNEGLSVSHEVLDTLESLDLNLVLLEDVDAYIEFLHTPLGEYRNGQKKLAEYKSQINYKEREEKYKDILPYSKIYGESDVATIKRTGELI